MRGADKLLEPVGGVPLLRRQTMAALATGCPVAVTLPDGDLARRACLAGLDLHIETVPHPEEGMSASLRHAARLLAEDQSLGILLPDVPGVTASEMIAVLATFRGSGETEVTRASQAGSDAPGTPLFLPHAIAKRFANLKDQDSGRSALKNTPITLVPFPDDRATRDLDAMCRA